MKIDRELIKRNLAFQQEQKAMPSSPLLYQHEKAQQQKIKLFQEGLQKISQESEGVRYDPSLCSQEKGNLLLQKTQKPQEQEIVLEQEAENPKSFKEKSSSSQNPSSNAGSSNAGSSNAQSASSPTDPHQEGATTPREYAQFDGTLEGAWAALHDAPAQIAEIVVDALKKSIGSLLPVEHLAFLASGFSVLQKEITTFLAPLVEKFAKLVEWHQEFLASLPSIPLPALRAFDLTFGFPHAHAHPPNTPPVPPKKPPDIFY